MHGESPKKTFIITRIIQCALLQQLSRIVLQSKTILFRNVLYKKKKNTYKVQTIHICISRPM